mmetsp:Transcript_76221/g.150753  ORF Transcript_76221/g.150753 Transcript_76221/m.150753 type:complete len:104 (-) Transcript_76221:7-318(-)
MVQRMLIIACGMMVLMAVNPVDALKCADYKKNGVAPPTDKDKCKTACTTGEGLKDGNCNAKGACSCKTVGSSYRDICTEGCSVANRVAVLALPIMALLLSLLG